MTLPNPSQPIQVCRPEIPESIWMPTPLRAGIPDVYSGTPL
jgi:hypothetical protein